MLYKPSVQTTTLYSYTFFNNCATSSKVESSTSAKGAIEMFPILYNAVNTFHSASEKGSLSKKSLKILSWKSNRARLSLQTKSTPSREHALTALYMEGGYPSKYEAISFTCE